MHKETQTLQWRRDEIVAVSNYLRPDCLLNHFSQEKKKSSTSLALVGESTGGQWIPLT